MSMHAFNLLQTNLLYMFCSSFESFILVGFQQTMGLPYLTPIFAGNSLYSSCMFQLSHSVGHIKSYFLKNKVILSSFLGHKNGPNYYAAIITLCHLF